jgi:hypothetical protein
MSICVQFSKVNEKQIIWKVSCSVDSPQSNKDALNNFYFKNSGYSEEQNMLLELAVVPMIIKLFLSKTRNFVYSK